MLKTDGTTSTLQNFLCLHRDYQGSILAITDNVGVMKEKRLFDAWGSLIKFWNVTSSIVPTTEGIMITDRGYTGHEHLLGVGLINMNGRLYDPILHRFLSPDNNLQDPSNTQNYNRYGYVLNNPLRYTDKTGEFLIIDDWLVGFFKGFFEGGNIGERFTQAWNGANKQATNSYKIWTGLGQGTNKQRQSRFGGEILQTTIGFIYSLFINTFGLVDTVEHYDGATVLKTYGDNVPLTSEVAGVTFGSYIIGNNTIAANANNPLFQHEYGHYLQSQASGNAYLFRYGIQSARGYKDVEYDANSRAFTYFYNETGGNFTWHFEDHTLNDRIDWNLRGDFYNNPAFQLALSGSLVKPKWYNYIFIP